MIVAIDWPARDINALIHVLEFVEIWLFVMLRITYQHAHVHQVSLATHSSNAEKFQQRHHSDKMNIHVHHLHVARTVIVAIMPVKRCALVNQTILELHQVVDQNAVFQANAHRIELVSIIDVLIHVQIHAESVLYVIQAIIIQFVLVQLDTLAIHLHNAQEYVSF